MMKCEWILCPVCGSKTRTKIRKDTVLENYPRYCPKCRQERLIKVCLLYTSPRFISSAVLGSTIRPLPLNGRSRGNLPYPTTMWQLIPPMGRTVILVAWKLPIQGIYIKRYWKCSTNTMQPNTYI